MNCTEIHPIGNGSESVPRAEFAAEDDADAPRRSAIGRRSGGWKDKSDYYRRNPNESVNNRRFYTKKKFGSFRVTPFAPRNTSSFIIRAKKYGGIASLVSPVTPDILKTPVFSPLPEVLVDMAKAEWGVNSYGSMKGFIRLKAEETSENVEVTSCMDVDELSEIHLEEDAHVEGFNLRIFELMYPAVYDCEEVINVSAQKRNAILECRLNYHDTQIAKLGEEKLIMSDRLLLMEREMEGLRRRVQYMETSAGVVALDGAMEIDGSETSIGDGYDDVGPSLVSRDDDTVKKPGSYDVVGHCIDRRKA